MQAAVQSAMYNALWSVAQAKATAGSSLMEDGVLLRITELAQQRVLFIVDIPLRGWYSAGGFPKYVSDYKRRHFRAEAGHEGTGGEAFFWIDTLRR